jgi:hypothetical protein
MAITGLRKVISDYRDYKTSFGEFAKHFASLSYGIRESGSPAADLCRVIESRIAERHLKLISEAVFHDAIASYSDAEALVAPIVMIDSLVVVSNSPSNPLSSQAAGEVKAFEFQLCAAHA